MEWLTGTAPNLTPAERAAQLGTTIHWSSVEALEKFKGTKDEPEAVAQVLRRTADYIYNRRDNGNPDNYNAVDLLDGMREDIENAEELAKVERMPSAGLCLACGRPDSGSHLAGCPMRHR